MAEPEEGSPAGAPRWVKVVGIIAVVVLLVLGIMMLVGGEHGPGRHAPSGVGAAEPSRVS
jgi:hypothetical protein